VAPEGGRGQAQCVAGGAAREAGSRGHGCDDTAGPNGLCCAATQGDWGAGGGGCGAAQGGQAEGREVGIGEWQEGFWGEPDGFEGVAKR